MKNLKINFDYRLILLVGLLLLTALTISTSHAADTIYVNGATGDDNNDGLTPGTAKATIQNGTDTVDPDGTVNVADGTYTENVIIDKNVNLMGESQTGTVIDGNDAGHTVDVYLNLIVSLTNLSIINGASTLGGGIVNSADLTLTNCNIQENTATNGGGIYTTTGSSLTLYNCNFDQNTAEFGGGAIYNNGGTLICNNCDFTDNHSNNDDGGAIYNSAAGTVTCDNCAFINNSADEIGGAICNRDFSVVTCNYCGFTSNSAFRGGAIYNSLSTITVIGSNLVSNTAEDLGGAFYNDRGTFTLNFNRIVGNTATASGQDIYNSGEGSNDALFNWWGSNEGPAAGRIEGGPVEYDPWLVMNYSANPTTIQQGATSTLTADFRYDSDGTFHDPTLGHLIDGTLVTFTTNLGNVGSKSTVVGTLNGIATAILRGDEAAGAALTSATLDSQTLYATVTITAVANAATTTTAVSGNTVGMQTTGSPLLPLVMAVLSVMGGLAATRKKQ